jgi:ribosome biogenesis GTPase A
MSASKNAILSAVQLMRDNRLPISRDTETAIASLENPVYKVGFVGQFQVGKSTLINRVFLRDDVLLKEGIGTCTTAVATEVAFGLEKRMEVYPWAKSSADLSATVGDDLVSGTVDAVTGAGVPVVTPDPTTDDIAKVTTSPNLATRMQLAQSTARVKLIWPSECLKRYTLLDTPGIDDPNTILLDNTTYRILPEVDVALLVVEPRELAEVDRNFLRSRMLDQGISRVMVLVSYKPQTRSIPESSRLEILETIRAQLSSIGREYIPVRMYCFDDMAGGSVLNSADAIEKEILGFLEANVEPGRIEKAAYVVKRDIQGAILQVATQQAFAARAEGEKRALLEQIRGKEVELKDKYEDIANSIGDELTLLKQRLVPESSTKLLAISDTYLKRFDACTCFAEAQDVLNRADVLMKPEVEAMVFDLVQTAKREAADVAKRHDQKAHALSAGWNELLSADLRVDGGLISRLPPIVVVVGDLVVSCLVLPGGPIVNLIERVIASRIPVIKRFLPEQIVMKLMVNAIKNSVRAETRRIAVVLSTVLDSSFRSASQSVKDAFTEAFTREVGAIRDVAEKSAPVTVSAEQRAAMARLGAGLEGALAGLQH